MVKLIPVEVSSQWPAPNLVNPPTRGNLLLIVSLLFTILSTLVIASRFYVRRVVLRQLYIDDYFIGAASLCTIGLGAATISAQYVGWDRHQWDQRPEWFEVNEMHMWIIQLFFVAIMTLAKLSTLIMYNRVVAAVSEKLYKGFVMATTVVVAAWGISFFFATLFNCYPVDQYWKSVDGAKCTDEAPRILAATVMNIITDLVVVFLPTKAIWRMNRSIREKAILMFLMALGLVYETLPNKNSSRDLLVADMESIGQRSRLSSEASTWRRRLITMI